MQWHDAQLKIGSLNTLISGIGVFYPDKEVKPTIAGIRAGRDEVLEAAMREILGPGAQKLPKP